jgi:hypothetical protein
MVLDIHELIDCFSIYDDAFHYAILFDSIFDNHWEGM